MQYHLLFKIHYSLTLYMTGLIWIIQVIHYPLFKLVGNNNFIDYHKGHIQKTSLVIAIPMVLEMLTSLIILFQGGMHRNHVFFLASSALLVLIWGVTFFISVLQHNILSKGFNDKALAHLIRTNWIRTIAWSIRAVLLFSLLP